MTELTKIILKMIIMLWNFRLTHIIMNMQMHKIVYNQKIVFKHQRLNNIIKIHQNYQDMIIIKIYRIRMDKIMVIQ